MNEIVKIENSNDSEIMKIILLLMELTGFKPQNISQESLVIIIQHVKNHYSKMNLTEIKQAVELGASGKLDVDLINYQNFNYLYVSNILQSYKRWKIKENLKPKPIEVSHRISEPKREKMTKEENAKHWFEWFSKEVENGNMPLIADWNAIYWWIETTGLINLTNEEKEIFLDLVREDLKDEIIKLKGADKIAEAELIYKQLIDIKHVQRECRKRMVIKHFENL